MFNRWRRFWLTAVGVGSLAASVLAGGGQTTSVFAAGCVAGTTTSGGHTTVTFCFTGAPQSWTVPAGVTGITVTADGAQGGAGGSFNSPPPVPGVYGSEYTASLIVTPGDTYSIEVGGAGSAGDMFGNGGAHGYNSGFAGSNGHPLNQNIVALGGGGGGGATAIWKSGNVLDLAAGGGGGGGGFTWQLPDPEPILPGGGGGGGGGYNATGMANGANGSDGVGTNDGSDGIAGTSYCNASASLCVETPVLAVQAGDGQLTITYPPLGALPTPTAPPTQTPSIPDIIIQLPTTAPTTTPTPTPTTTPTTPSCGETAELSLSGLWTLVAWPGASGTPVAVALSGGADHCGSSITSQVAVVWGFDSATQTYHAYFPSATNVPGANDLTSLTQGLGYWVALNDPSSNVTWKVETA